MMAVSGASAGEADVIAAKAALQQEGTYRFDVTIAHADTGWEHYADAFEVLDMDGKVLGTRTLLHPHVDEQPFTRSLLGVVIPKGVQKVTIRAHDSVHEYGGREIVLTLPLK
ncbi:hypothetical protein MNBD_ALPHA12-2258 [hydrothermal vent metagenome]|uniref:Uncharacterized protein n=1 Tax=hydrothermal vent metagenome TaxID=652676 RepID=A0A3B0TY02_9ZZZZ